MYISDQLYEDPLICINFNTVCTKINSIFHELPEVPSHCILYIQALFLIETKFKNAITCYKYYRSLKKKLKCYQLRNAAFN